MPGSRVFINACVHLFQASETMFTAWGVGQPSGAAMLLLGVDARAEQARQMLDNLLQLAEAAGQAVARGDDVSACEVGSCSAC